jgi:hypothetical protein
MSNFPSCLQTTRPSTSIVLQGDELTPAQVGLLRTQLRSLHFHPIIVVLPKHYKVKNGDAMVEEVAKTWELSPHGMLIIYAPLDKSVYAACGEFNTRAGVEPQFFKRDFAQRMPAEAQEENLFSALNASLQDVDRIIIRSDAYINRSASTHLSVQPARTDSSHRGGGPVYSLALLILGVLTVAIMFRRDPAKRRTRLNDSYTGLDHDLNRINRLTGTSGAQLDQVPMAEFKKRASVSGPGRRTRDNLDAIKLARAGSLDPAADFQSAIDHSAAQSRLDPNLYVASFGGENSPADSSEFAPGEAAVSGSAASLSSSVDAASLAAPPVVLAPEVTRSFAFPDAPAGVFPDASYLTDPQGSPGADASSMLSINMTVPGSNSSTPGAVHAASSAPFAGSMAASTAAESVDSLAAPPGAADQFNSSFASQLLTSIATPTAAFAGLGSSGGEAAAVNCPKCSEPKSKDFSFCIKCGHLY